MKSLAQQLREFMDQVAEAPVTPTVDYDFPWEIENPVPPPADWTEEQIENDYNTYIEVGIKYRIEGEFRSGRVGHIDNWTPDEHPDFDGFDILNLETGEDITDLVMPKLSKQEVDGIEAACWNDWDERIKAAADDYYDRQRDDYDR